MSTKKTDKKLSKYLGYKFFKNIEGSDKVDLIRVTRIFDEDDKCKVKDCDTGEERFTTLEDLKGYTPLEPTGFITFAKVGIHDETIKTLMNYDIIVSLYRLIDVKLNINEPYAICRQSINDFFYTMMSGNPYKEYVGVCASRENCPSEIPYYYMAACDEVYNFNIVHFYLTDTINDMLSMIDTTVYDKVLEKLYQAHMKATNPAYIPDNDKRLSHFGWCRSLKTLLEENNVQTDMDTLRNVSSIDFNIMDYVEIKDEDGLEVYYANKELRDFISNTFKINIKDKCIIIKFDVDIDLSEFSNTNYVLIRDNQNNTYIISYILDGEYRESELVKDDAELSVSDKLRLSFYDKYNNQK